VGFLLNKARKVRPSKARVDFWDSSQPKAGVFSANQAGWGADRRKAGF
jgi:hypothetical protein